MAPYLDTDSQTYDLARNAKVQYNDWRDEFFAKGYIVLKNVIPEEKATYYHKKMLEWLSSFGTEFDINKRETWKKENLPKSMNNGMYFWHCAAHEKYVWEARQEPGVLDAFAKIWNTDELIVSYDTVNITLPNARDMGPVKPWPHTDQAPERKGLSCVQGIINLSPAGPKDGGLLVMENSAPLHEQFFELNPPDRSKEPLKSQHYDYFSFEDKDMEWYKSKGCKFVKVCAEPGDLILWDSRTVHYAVYPETDQIRTIIYACYTPAALASPENLQKKKEIFERWDGTTHWPHTNLSFRGKAMIDGKIDPLERTEPREKPELTDKLLKLAGVKPY